jgi:hypothetical protein
MASRLDLESIRGELLMPVEVLTLDSSLKWTSGGDILLPFLYDNQSNYLAVAVGQHLEPRVFYIPHDDDPRILFRNLNSCYAFLIQTIQSGKKADAALYEAVGDYPPADPRRSSADQHAARYLMSTAGTNNEWYFAVQLLDANNLHEWATLLDTDHFVRRDVRKRMALLSTPGIEHLLREDQLRFDQFVAAVADAAHAKGLSIGKQRFEMMQIGGDWCNLEVFFHRRGIPEAVPRMITWLEDQSSGFDPRERAGHFFDDGPQ